MHVLQCIGNGSDDDYQGSPVDVITLEIKHIHESSVELERLKVVKSKTNGQGLK